MGAGCCLFAAGIVRHSNRHSCFWSGRPTARLELAWDYSLPTLPGMVRLGFLDTHRWVRRRERLAWLCLAQAAEQDECFVRHPHRHLVLGGLAPAPVLLLRWLYGAGLLSAATGCAWLSGAGHRADVVVQQHAWKHSDGCSIPWGLQLLACFSCLRRVYQSHHRCVIYNLGSGSSRSVWASQPFPQ